MNPAKKHMKKSVRSPFFRKKEAQFSQKVYDYLNL